MLGEWSEKFLDRNLEKWNKPWNNMGFLPDLKLSEKL